MYSIFKPDNWRYERKFSLSGISNYEVESVVKLHPALFSEIYHERTVNNLYFDSFGMTNYLDNVFGNSRRLKVRIRWYGSLFGAVEKPVLEIKIKSGYLGSKKAYPINAFSMDKSVSLDTIRHLFKRSSHIPEIIKHELISLNFALLNNYKRKYFQSADKRFRITIDSGMQFFKIDANSNVFLNAQVEHSNTILELKYNENDDDAAEIITNHFPFRMTKSSKYVTGLDLLAF